MEVIDLIVRDVAEIPDRNSPEGQPEMMLVTDAELRAIIEKRLGPDGVTRLWTGPVTDTERIMFRAGLVAAREWAAHFIEAESPHLAASIRANWFPELGPDFGPPRKHRWNEVTEGEFGTPSFRAKNRGELDPTLEALPVAFKFLMGYGLPGTYDYLDPEPAPEAESAAPASA